MKLIGALLFICTTSWIGFDMSTQLTKRTKQIRQMIQSLQLLEAEMGYSQMKLQQTFAILSKKTSYPIASFYDRLAYALTDAIPDFLSVWDQEVDHLQTISALKQNELDILKQFGRNLGQHTFIEQQKHIVLAIHHLQTELEEANEQRQKYEKVTKSLGVLIGLFIVLLLL